MGADRRVGYRAGVRHSTQQIEPGRSVAHPGPVTDDRVTAVRGRTRPQHFADLLSGSPAHPDASGPGARFLVDAVTAAVDAAGADSGIVEFSTVRLPHISYCFPAAGDAVRPMLYSETHTSSGTVFEATATVGWRRRPSDEGESPADLERWVHFHASWVDDAGMLRGGHLWPDTTVAGTLDRATVWPLYGITLVNAFDDETELPVFTPVRAEAPATAAPLSRGDRDAVFARVRPNQEIHGTVRGLTTAHGLAGGAVRGGTGSFVGAMFDDGRTIEGPATEVISLAGRLDDTAAGPLTCSLITARGTVASGRLAAEGNIVGATYDLLLTGPVETGSQPLSSSPHHRRRGGSGQ